MASETLTTNNHNKNLVSHQFDQLVISYGFDVSHNLYVKFGASGERSSLILGHTQSVFWSLDYQVDLDAQPGCCAFPYAESRLMPLYRYSWCVTFNPLLHSLNEKWVCARVRPIRVRVYPHPMMCTPVWIQIRSMYFPTWSAHHTRAARVSWVVFGCVLEPLLPTSSDHLWSMFGSSLGWSIFVFSIIIVILLIHL